MSRSNNVHLSEYWKQHRDRIGPARKTKFCRNISHICVGIENGQNLVENGQKSMNNYEVRTKLDTKKCVDILLLFWWDQMNLIQFYDSCNSSHGSKTKKIRVHKIMEISFDLNIS